MAKKRTAHGGAAKLGRGSTGPRRGPRVERKPPSHTAGAGDTEVISSPDTKADPQAPTLPPFIVVGIGASAGGVEALTQFFRALPARTGMVFVVVQHIARSQEGMPDVLRAATKMSVAQV